MEQPMSLLNEPKKPFWTSLAFKVAVGVAVVVVVGTGVALAARILDPLWNPFRPSPEKVMEKVFNKIEKITSLSSDFNIAVNLPDNEGFSARLKDSSDMSDIQNPKSKGSLEATIKTQGIQLLLGGEYSVLDKSLFVKLNKVPFIPLLPIDLGSLKNKWIKLNADNTDSVNNPSFVDFLKQRKEFFTVKQELKDEKVNKINCYHYVLGINGDKIASLLNNLAKDISNPLSGETPELTNEQIKQVADKVGEIEVGYWISKKDNLPIKIKINKNFNAEGETISFDLEANFSDYGRKFEVNAPDSFMGIEEIMGLMGK